MGRKMKYKTMRIATVKDEGVYVQIQQYINGNGIVIGSGTLNQKIVEWHRNKRQPYKRVYLWLKYVKGIVVRLAQTVTGEGIVLDTATFEFQKPRYTIGQKKARAKIGARRKRQLGFHPISLIHDGCIWHHVNENDVVACPPYAHSHVSHVCGDGKLEGVIG